MSGCILRLAASHSPVFLLNSCLDLFTAPRLYAEGPFSRSYGADLPSSLTVNLSSALVYSTQPPVSVYGTGLVCLKHTARVFLGVRSLTTITPAEAFVYFHGSSGSFPPTHMTTPFQRTIPSVRVPFASPSPLVLNTQG